MSWDDEDDDWGKPLPDDPESRARREETTRGIFSASGRALRYAYMVIGLLVVLIIILWATQK